MGDPPSEVFVSYNILGHVRTTSGMEFVFKGARLLSPYYVNASVILIRCLLQATWPIIYRHELADKHVHFLLPHQNIKVFIAGKSL